MKRYSPLIADNVNKLADLLEVRMNLIKPQSITEPKVLGYAISPSISGLNRHFIIIEWEDDK